jgi:uncharacterized protein (DUF302 family)
MSTFAITKETKGSIEEICQRVTEAIKPAGFGVLTHIDFAQKINEKLGETIRPCVILGACHPKLAHEAYKQSSDVALLIPCNIVVTDLGEGKVRIEAMRPTQMLNLLPAVRQRQLIEDTEAGFERALAGL